jgi:hypothetical protein
MCILTAKAVCLCSLWRGRWLANIHDWSSTASWNGPIFMMCDFFGLELLRACVAIHRPIIDQIHVFGSRYLVDPTQGSAASGATVSVGVQVSDSTYRVSGSTDANFVPAFSVVAKDVRVCLPSSLYCLFCFHFGVAPVVWD